MPKLPLSFWDLLVFPISLPTKGFIFVLESLVELAERDLFNPNLARQRLLELESAHEMGDIEEDEYLTERSVLEEYLRTARSGR